MGTIGGELATDWEEAGADVGYAISGPMLGVSYAIMTGGFPVLMRAGLGARSGYARGSFSSFIDDAEYTVYFKYFDMWVTTTYPINNNMNLYAGPLIGMPLSGSEMSNNENPIELEDDAMPNGMDMSLVFGLSYDLPGSNGGLVLDIGYVMGFAELENTVTRTTEDGQAKEGGQKWNHSGFFMLLNYNFN